MKKENTSARLQQLMKERNLKQVDILEAARPYCEKYGVKLGRNDLSQYVSGKVEPGQKKLSILGMTLNVNEAWLMGYDVLMERIDEELLQKQKESRKLFAQKWNIQYFEKKMLESFSPLSDENKKKAIDYTENLLKIQNLDNEQSIALEAAHERTDIDIPDNIDTSDDNIMDDENF